MVPDEYLGISVDELIDKWFSLLDSTYDSGPMDIDDRERLELLTLLRELKHGGKEMAKKDKEHRLCYVSDGVMFFTDNFEGAWGDDWDDITYSGGDEPYTWQDDKSDDWNMEHHRGHFRHIGFYSEHESLRPPFDFGRYSIEDVNKKAAPWLYSDEAGGLMAGATIDEAIEWCRKGKIKWGELTE